MKSEHCHHNHGNNSDALYGVGVIGALAYFLQGASGLVPVLEGAIKAFFWPAFVVFKVLGMLHI